MSITSQLKKKKRIGFGFKHEDFVVNMGSLSRGIQQATEKAGSEHVKDIRPEHPNAEDDLINASDQMFLMFSSV